MANIIDKLKTLEEKENLLEEEYKKTLEKFKEKKEIINKSDIFADLESLYSNKGYLENELGLSSISNDNYDRARNFYEKYSFVWKYIDISNNFIEPNDQNIYYLGLYMFNDIEDLFTKEELETVKCGIYNIDDMDEECEPYFYILTTIHPIYKIAAICLRLESLGFRDIYELEKNCSILSTNINKTKLAIKKYKLEISKKLVIGGIKKSEQTFNTIIKPKVNNVIIPGIDQGIKKILKKVEKSEDNQ